ncbi:2,3-bisphosphoglycerate-independent phosphoglycerate mutase [Candidatus Falkowbacteria bacterium]|nr:2,3-bisphosphoglycerate-independent phosphoglycerate mutase [Candidatus Falkowbacteria bacterium]
MVKKKRTTKKKIKKTAKATSKKTVRKTKTVQKTKKRKSRAKSKAKAITSKAILLILDGWGVDKPNRGNAIHLAKTPTIDGLAKKHPSTKLYAHGKYVGLPSKQVGNSEAGHMNIGAGRVVKQDAVMINESIKNGTFFKNTAFKEAFNHVKKNKSKLHIIGMLSNGMSPHSDTCHIEALLKMTRKEGLYDNVYVHAFTDGRDSPQHEALKLINCLERDMCKWGCYIPERKNNGSKNGKVKVKIATVMGRFYAMDRNKKWERTKEAYEAMVYGKARTAQNASTAIVESYNRNETDEFIKPYVLDKKGLISDNDAVIFFNLRSDRARQLVKVFVQKNFQKRNPKSFTRKRMLKNLRFVAMTDFGPDLDHVLTAYPSIDIPKTLPLVLDHKLKQCYIAESEKYAHVTYFFNGGYPGRVNGEDQIMIHSPNVKSYDETPPMKSFELTKRVLKDLSKNKYDLTVLNFAAPDMVAHTGNLKASIKCCEDIDACVKKIVDAYLKKNGTVIITSDHGNIEGLINLKTWEVDTEHSTCQVPFILVNKQNRKSKLRSKGSLSDIAPTILDLFGTKKPALMTGKSLLKKR